MQFHLTGARSFYFAIVALCFLNACGSDILSSENDIVVLNRPAKLLEVGHINNDDFLRYPAVIQSQQLSTLSFEVGGMLKKLLVIEGQGVKQGEVLAILDQRNLQTKLNSARAQYDNANAEYQRAVRLMKGNAIARSVLEQRKSESDVNKAHLESAEKALQDSVLVAPYDGNIASLAIKEQEIVQAGKPAIGVLGAGGLEATINLPSNILAKAGGQDAKSVYSYIILDAAPEQRIPAVFKKITLEADTVSQTYALTFTFEAPEDLIILPGMNAVVWLKDPSKSVSGVNKISVPLTAIATDGDQKYVWVVDKKSMVVSRRAITIVQGVGENLDVASGLDAGETIVAAGISSLSKGMTVRPWLKK